MTLSVIFGPTNVADQGPATAEALTRLGVRATTYSSVRHSFYPDADIQESRASRSRALVAARRFFQLAEQFDVAHLQSAAFLPPLSRQVPSPVESWYLHAVVSMIRRLQATGRVVAVTFHGSDVRPVAEIAERWDASGEVLALPGHQPAARARRIRYSLAVAEACDLVFVTTPDLLPLVPESVLSPVVPSRAFTRALESADPRPPARARESLRVLHAPSKPVIKGTAHIEAAVRRAQSAGVPIDFRLLTGAPTQSVVEAMLSSDVVVDQVNFGWYSAVAVEAMSLGRPAIARIDPHYAVLFSAATGSSVDGLGPIHADAASLDRVLARLHSADETTWDALRARASRAYSSIHAPDVVARLILDRYLQAQGAA